MDPALLIVGPRHPVLGRRARLPRAILLAGASGRGSHTARNRVRLVTLPVATGVVVAIHALRGPLVALMRLLVGP